ncbi:SHOCT domain-containing protein [Agaribacterium haliotis]|uniref:SHOCT domain-containing protein n=1 Tax=Agaribacterium haliotis TaxID=2013869 RepID=UPI000BB53391|nr:SHOCT domain-containing protein [Agaribacterium haliotis]
MKQLALSSALMVLSAFAQAKEETKKISIADSVNPAECQLLASESCETQKQDADKKCNKVHRKQAQEAGANTIVIGERSVKTSRRPFYDGSYKTIKKTSIAASYYHCEVEQATPAKTSGNMKSKGSAEERLLRLNSLKEKGLISEKEYQDKRQQILDEL